MKKTLLALAVAGISTSALAAGNIYDNGTTSFNLKGEIDTYVSTVEGKENGATTTKRDVDVDLWAKIQIDSEHKLNEDVTLFGSFELENGEFFDKDSSSDHARVRTDDLYFGAYFGDNWGVALGEVGDFGDSLDAITIDNTNEGLGYVDDFVKSKESAGHAVSVKGSFDKLTVIADAYLDQNEKIDTAFGLSAQYAINEMFTVGASYQDQENRDIAGTDYQVMGAAVRFNMENFSAAVNYVAEELNKADQDTWSAVAAYQMNEARVYTSFGFTEYEGDHDQSYYTFGADYAVTGNVLTFIEYTASENDNKDASTKLEADLVVAGVYYTF
ncbi:porin [Vibrio jasicida]|jgi:outer membrane porin protein LC|uniref:porin n=1 Tax=Vibrio jasicida TaxID=766224 RepID=UPI00163F6FF9|nr:porin [Vibrio jasicida]